jgi:outer membrane protein assembly factor BamE (lipoprotein component of BamABCDE complex)
MKQAATLLAALALAGCVSSGTQVTEEQAGQFQKGITTEQEVIAKLGTPNATTRQSDGSAVIVYTYVRARPNAVDFVPIVGLLAGGATAQANTVTFTFDSSGVLKSYSATASNSEVHTGIAN